MEKDHIKKEEPVLPGDETGHLTGSAPQQGMPVKSLQDELPENQHDEDSQKRKPVKAEEMKKLKK
jgi:hypothetical protein